MFYKPFKTIKQVEPYINRHIYYKYKEFKILGAYKDPNLKILLVKMVDQCGEDFNFSALDLFYNVENRWS